MFSVSDTPLEGVKHIVSRRFSDHRGFFAECFRDSDFRLFSGGKSCLQLNRSFSRKNVIRGIHFQNPRPQGKLIFAMIGEICDVAVDLRKYSPTFGRSFSISLSSDRDEALYIPEGFGHGFSVLSEEALIMYACTDIYCPECEQCIAFDDPDIAADWRIDLSSAVVSDKDRAGVSLNKARLFV